MRFRIQVREYIYLKESLGIAREFYLLLYINSYLVIDKVNIFYFTEGKRERETKEGVFERAREKERKLQIAQQFDVYVCVYY